MCECIFSVCLKKKSKQKTRSADPHSIGWRLSFLVFQSPFVPQHISFPTTIEILCYATVKRVSCWCSAQPPKPANFSQQPARNGSRVCVAPSLYLHSLFVLVSLLVLARKFWVLCRRVEQPWKHQYYSQECGPPRWQLSHSTVVFIY